MKNLMKIKSKKGFLIFLLGMILSLGTVDVFAGDFINELTDNHGGGSHGHGHFGSGGGNTVGAPLDGGIITIILAGAGIAYFTRKRKKNNEQ